MKRRILLVDDDLAVLLTLKAVFELHGFEVETASSSVEAFARIESSEYQMVISDLRMETEEAGLEVIRTARRQSYDPATALLTAYPPSRGWNSKSGSSKPDSTSVSDKAGSKESVSKQSAAKQSASKQPGLKQSGPNRFEDEGQQDQDEDWIDENSASLLIKPLGTGDLLRQVEALLIQQADRQQRRRNNAAEA